MRKTLIVAALLLALAGKVCAQGTGITVVPTGSSSSSPTSSLVQSGLLADYLLIDGSGTTIKDSSAAGNNGTFCANAPTWIAAPTLGLSFLGSSKQCVSLPAALNSARTFFFYLDTTQNVGFFQGFLSGNGGGIVTNNTNLFWVAQPTAQQFQTFANQPRGGTSTFDHSNPYGVGLITVVFDTTDRHFYNGVEATAFDDASANAGTPSAGNMTVGNYQLGGTPTGSGQGFDTFHTGPIYRVVVYNRVLTAAELAQNHNAILSQMAARGLVTNFGMTLTTDNIISVGDSETSGFGVTTPWPSIIVPTNGAWTVFNAGAGGRTALGFSQGELLENLPILHPNPARNMEITLFGVNDIASKGRTAAATERAIESFHLKLSSQRVPTVVCTILSVGGFDATAQALNQLTRQYWPAYSNALCDLAANPSIGATGASASTNFFTGDSLHPNQNSHYNIMAPIAQSALNHVHGNRDQSTATVYASAAAAAVATTAGSEATNTVTITTAATPANCQVGNLVIVTGVTPTGYNTTVANFFGLGAANILTRSATQITYYNQTTGLGAVTVQGTVVCPQQQDNDVYSVLNFGAGNYTLQSCEQWMGQPISIKNINAGASTVVPFAGMPEQIDGAANLTLAAGATAVLWPRLVSAAAGGCNWFREQNN